MKQRNHAFDFLCGLCILRMMLLHIISMCGYRGEFWFGKLMAWSFFFMSFFFFKAGYFNKTVAGDSVSYIKDKAKRLLVPYFVWGAIGSVIYFGFMLLFPEYFEKMISRLSWKHVYDMSHFYGDPPCWFLMSFFVAYVAIHFIYKVKYLHLAIVTFPFISYYLWKEHNPLWLSLNNVFMGVFYFYLGHLWKMLQHKVTRRQIIGISVTLILIFIVGNKMKHGEYDMSLNKFVQNPWGAGINTTCALCGISGLLLALPMKRIPVINYIGEHSMVFFVAHYPLIYFYIFTHRIYNRSIVHHWDEFITLTTFVLVICFFLVPFVEKVPILSGRFKKKV